MRLFLESQPNKKYEGIFYMRLFHVFFPFMVFGIVLSRSDMIFDINANGNLASFSSNLFVLFPDIFNLLFFARKSNYY